MRTLKLVLGCALLTATAGAMGTWILVAGSGTRRDIRIGSPGKVPRQVLFNFGKVYNGQTSTRRLTLRNTSARTLSLGEKTGCGCTRVKIFSPTIPPGGRSVVKISYIGFPEEENGPVTQKFLIFDTGGQTVVPEVEGTVKAFRLDALRFNRLAVDWSFIPGESSLQSVRVNAENVLSYPINVTWAGGEKGQFFSIYPTSAEIGPGKFQTFLFRPVGGLTLCNHPEVAASTLWAQVLSPAGSIALKFGFHIYATPEPILQAIPGALVLSVTGRSAVIRSIRLVTGPGIEKPPHVLTVTTTNPELRAVLKSGIIRISLRLKPGEQLFEANVIAAYFYHGVKQKIDIPVFAARRNMVQ